MKSHSDLQEQDHFDEKDAIATIVMITGGMSEQEARNRLEMTLKEGSAAQRRELEHVLLELRSALGKFPDTKQKRKAVVLAAKMATTGGRWFPHTAPGSLMLGIAHLLFSRRKVARVFGPLVADYRLELSNACREGAFKVICVKLQYWYAFSKACGLDVALDLLGKIMKVCGL